MKKHIEAVDLAKFLAIGMIMTHHSYLLSMPQDYPFSRGWVWVDYFFMITGYFTIAHFKKHPVTDGKIGEAAVAYTFKKFMNFMPMVLVAIFLEYIFYAARVNAGGNFWGFLSQFVNMPFEMLMLSSPFGFNPLASQMWFLSAMFITMPLMIYLMLRAEQFWYIASFLVPILYYGKYHVNTVRDYPMEMIRAFACMTFGTFVYFVADYLKKMEISKLGKLALTVIELTAFVLAVLVSGGHKSELVFLVLLFPINLIILLSGQSYTSNIEGPIVRFLGELSLPIFIFHWLMATITNQFIEGFWGRLAFYYLSTLVVSTLVVVVKRLIRKKRGK